MLESLILFLYTCNMKERSFQVFGFVTEKDSHAHQAGHKHTLNWSSCPCLLSAEIVGVHHYARLTHWRTLAQGFLCAGQTLSQQHRIPSASRAEFEGVNLYCVVIYSSGSFVCIWNVRNHVLFWKGTQHPPADSFFSAFRWQVPIIILHLSCRRKLGIPPAGFQQLGAILIQMF